MWKRITIGLLILLTFILQTSVFRFLSIGGITPNLLLILTVSLGFMRGRRTGLLVGFISGFLADLIYSDVVGVYAFTYMIIGFLVGFFYKVYYDEGIRVPLLFVGIGDLAFHGIFMILTRLLKGPFDFLATLRSVVMPEMVYTLIISILMYRILYFINKRFVENEVEGQDLPWLKR